MVDANIAAMPDLALWILAAIIAWFFWAAFCRWLLDNPRQDVPCGLVVRGFQVYARLLHNLRHIGLENVPDERFPGPLIIVANHTAGIDPVVIQAGTRFETRWLMAQDMQLPVFKSFWDWSGVIAVRRGAQDASAIRVAIRHLRDAAKDPEGKGAIGVFPEGGIETPPEQVLPFMPGVGMIIKTGRCPVLPVIIRGAPQVEPAWASLWRTSKTTVEFKPLIHYEDTGLAPDEIASDLRERFLEWTGWPANNTTPPWDPSMIENPESPFAPARSRE